MRADLRRTADAAMDKLCTRPFVPDIESKAGHWRAPYDNGPDQERWLAMMASMFQTRQAAVMNSFFNQLTALIPDLWDDGESKWITDIEGLRSMLGLIQSMNPKTTAQAALAAQLVALHLNIMKLAKSLSSHSYGDARTTATMARCSKAFADGLLALQKLQGKARKSKQTIRVETHHHQHIHYETGGIPINGGQAQGTDGGAVIQCAALPSPDEAGQPLPGSGGKGQTRLPVPRGRSGKRSATRRS